MPRRTDDPLDRYMRFRCTEQEGERLMRLAKSRSLTFSEFARQQLLADRRRRRGSHHTAIDDGKGEGSAPETETKALAFQIQRVGVNLNQIVKAMNSFQAPPPPELAPLLDEIRRYVRRANHLPKTHVP